MVVHACGQRVAGVVLEGRPKPAYWFRAFRKVPQSGTRLPRIHIAHAGQIGAIDRGFRWEFTLEPAILNRPLVTIEMIPANLAGVRIGDDRPAPAGFHQKALIFAKHH